MALMPLHTSRVFLSCSFLSSLPLQTLLALLMLIFTSFCTVQPVLVICPGHFFLAQKLIHVFCNPKFIVWITAGSFYRHHCVWTEMNVVCDTVHSFISVADDLLLQSLRALLASGVHCLKDLHQHLVMLCGTVHVLCKTSQMRAYINMNEVPWYYTASGCIDWILATISYSRTSAENMNLLPGFIIYSRDEEMEFMFQSSDRTISVMLSVPVTVSLNTDWMETSCYFFDASLRATCGCWRILQLNP